jgi:hypothetical protein
LLHSKGTKKRGTGKHLTNYFKKSLLRINEL